MIDLGHVSAPVVTVWPRRRHHSRRWLSAVVAVGILLLVGAAASPPSDPMPFVASLPIDATARLVLVGERVFALDEPDGHPRIQAYGLPAGRVLWTARVDGSTDAARIFASGSTIVVDARPVDASTHTIAGFDAATGRELWHLTAHGTMGDATGLLVWPSESGPFNDGSSEFERVDATTGRVEWTATLGNDCQTILDPSTGFIELCDSGRTLSVLDVATGRVRARRALDVGVGNRRGPFGSGLALIGSVIVVSTDRGPDVNVTAFRAQDLDPVWNLKEEQATVLADNCKPQICLETPHGTVTLNTETGAQVPTAGIAPLSTIALHPQSGVLEFVIVPAAPTSGPTVTPFDVMVTPVTPAGDEFSIGDYAPGHATATWITQQLRDGSYRPVAALHGVGGSCGFVSAYAICATGPNRLSLWRLPPLS